MINALMQARMAVDELADALRGQKQQIADRAMVLQRPRTESENDDMGRFNRLIEEVEHWRDRTDAILVDILK